MYCLLFISNKFIILFNFSRSCFNLTSISATSERSKSSVVLSLVFGLLSSFLYLSYFVMKSCLSNIFIKFFELFEYSTGTCLNDTVVSLVARMEVLTIAGVDVTVTDFANSS